MIEIHQIVPYLWLSGTPGVEDIQQLKKLKISLIVSTHVRPVPREVRNAFEVAYYPWIDFVLLPQPLTMLHAATERVRAAMHDKRQVLIHCRVGRHRSVALVGCVLVAEGMEPNAAMRHIKKQRLVADPDAWHIKRQIRAYESYIGRMR